jgi:virginiamycin A acetyltransferase
LKDRFGKAGMGLSDLLFRLYALRSRLLRSLILRLVSRLEGGQIYSETLRKIFAYHYGINIGMYSYGGCFNYELIGRFTEIGRYCSFAEGVCIFNGNHPLQFKSMHPFFYNPALDIVEHEMITRGKLVVGNDVWVGRNVIILPAVHRIGDGAVLGAGAVVTKDVPDFAVVAGNPARIIKYRFSEPVRLQLKESRWWEKSIDEIKGRLDEFTKPFEGVRE